MDSLLKLKNVNLKYQTGNDTIKVLKNVNLETKKNESISIVGESGSGKTSLMIVVIILRLLMEVYLGAHLLED